jgi:hypothetical protein
MYKQFLPVAFAAVAFAAPQVPDLSALPACAQGIVLSQINATPCGTDIACVCRGSSFVGNLRNLITAQCGEADAAAADAFHKSTCAANGVTIDAAPASTTSTIELGSAGPTVTSTTTVPSGTMGSSSTMSGSVTGNPSMTATNTPSLDGQGSCSVSVTTVCHTATVAPTSTGQVPAGYTGGASAMGVSGAVAFFAVAAALF